MIFKQKKSKNIILVIMVFMFIGIIGTTNSFSNSLAIIPIMTGNHSPSPFSITGSSYYSAERDYYKVLDNDDSTVWLTPHRTLTGWLEIDLGSEKIVETYSITGSSINIEHNPESFVIEGSNTGDFNGEQSILDTQTGVADWTLKEVKSFTIYNQSAFRYYRINITQNNGSIDYLGFTQLQLYEKVITLDSINAECLDTNLNVNDTTQITVTANYSDGSANDITNESTYTIDNENVATVSTTGLITAISEGTAIITVAKDVYSDTITLNVSSVESQGNKALLTIKMENGTQYEYDLSKNEVDNFIEWYDNRASGNGKAYFIIDKTFNMGPFISRKDYIVFDKVLQFEVMEYTQQ